MMAIERRASSSHFTCRKLRRGGDTVPRERDVAAMSQVLYWHTGSCLATRSELAGGPEATWEANTAFGCVMAQQKICGGSGRGVEGERESGRMHDGISERN